MRPAAAGRPAGRDGAGGGADRREADAACRERAHPGGHPGHAGSRAGERPAGRLQAFGLTAAPAAGSDARRTLSGNAGVIAASPPNRTRLTLLPPGPQSPGETMFYTDGKLQY